MESQSFNLLHAIVDSVWVAKEGAEETDCLELADKIQTKLNLPLSFEGKYRWIIFLTKLNLEFLHLTDILELSLMER